MRTVSIAYFPPISYFSLLRSGGVAVEAHENYQKQSWRNRCNILSANGVASLQVPVVHDGGTFRHPITEIRVDYSTDWLSRHERTIDSAYMSSAYFSHYRDALFAILERRYERLWELDMEILRFFLNLYRIPEPVLTEDFANADAGIHPKRPDPVYVERPYFQVFGHKYGFIPNLSIMDLLFNEGPDTDFLRCAEKPDI